MLFKNKKYKLVYEISNSGNSMGTIKVDNQIRALRYARDLTTDDLARKVNIPQSYISRF